MATFISHSPAETESLGETWGRSAQSGLVIGLSGDLGAGKTRLVKGLARGLGITARVYSPTFALVNIYEGGRLPLYHLDLYRMDTIDQILSAGLEEYLQPQGVTVIEWAERWFGTGTGTTDYGTTGPRDHGLRTTDHRPKTTDQGLQLPITDHQSPVTDHRSPVTSHQSPITPHLFHVRLETLSETERRITYEDPGP